LNSFWYLDKSVAQRFRISSIVLFLSRAIDEVGPAVDAPKPVVVWDVAGLVAADSVDGVALDALLKIEPAGAAAVVEEAAAPEAGVVVLAVAVVVEEAAAGVDVAPNKLGGFVAVEVALLVAGVPNWDLGASVVVVPVVGLFVFPKRELGCVADVAAVPGADALGVCAALVELGKSEPPAGFEAAAPPNKEAGFDAAVGSAGFDCPCCPKSERLPEPPVAPLVSVAAGFVPNIDEGSAGFVALKRDALGF
jgi:hypothetical protein